MLFADERHMKFAQRGTPKTMAEGLSPLWIFHSIESTWIKLKVRVKFANQIWPQRFVSLSLMVSTLALYEE